jgi:alpha-tubulin suppressor-like RCC1 family protein
MSSSLLRIAALLCLCTSLAACAPTDSPSDGDPTAPPASPPSVTALSIAPADLALTGAGATGSLTAAVLTSQGLSSNTPVSWSSASPTIASVQGTGQQATVTAVGVGTTTITATAGTRSATATVRVLAAARTLTVSVTGAGRIVSAPAGIDCTAGAASGCVASFADGTSVSLAALPAAGQLLAGWSGACGGAATCQVTMTDVRSVQATFSTVVLPVASVTVAPSVATIAPGSTAPLTATVRDAAGQPITGRTITWLSADPAVVTVSATGVVTAVGAGGPVAVTATVEGVSGSAQLTVRSPFLTAVSVGTSEQLTCAVEASGEAWCWGDNGYGQRGIGTVGSVSGVTRVVSTHAFSTIDVGRFHACAGTRAGEVYCWGSNVRGEIGDGTIMRRQLPVRVGGGQLAATVLAGDDRSCALELGGTLRCWGYSNGGFLGIGSAEWVNAEPRTVAGGITFREVVVSKSSPTQCGVDTNAQAWCWGNNSGGMLGDGTSVGRSAPVRVQGGLSFTQVSPGDGHSCGITTAGVLYCWGSQQHGQLGNGIVSSAEVRSPLAVTTPLRFTSVAAGFRFSCAITTEGALYCWGDNSTGSLGDGSYTNRLFPTPALTTVRFTRVVAGRSNVCAIAESGILYCWGLNGSGSVSGGGSSPINVPVAIPRP